MRQWLMNAPRWKLALVMGGLWAAMMAVFGLLRRDAPWPTVLLSVALGGALFGAIMGPFMHRLYRRHREAVGAADPAVERAAIRATWRGPFPEDPKVRAAAIRLIDHQLAQMRRQRVFSFVVAVAFIALSVSLAVRDSPWWWLAVAFWAVIFTSAVVGPRRLQRRAGLLRNG